MDAAITIDRRVTGRIIEYHFVDFAGWFFDIPAKIGFNTASKGQEVQVRRSRTARIMLYCKAYSKILL